MKKRPGVHKGNRPVRWVILAAVTVLAGYYLFGRNEPKGATSSMRSLPPREIAGAAPGFTLTDLTGAPVSLAGFRGKVVVLDFWATWCPPCRMEIPDFIRLQKEYGSQDVQIVGIALDEPDKVQGFAAKNGMNYPVLLGTDEVSMRYGGIESIPTTFIIDRQGRIVNKFVGFTSREVFEAEIKKLL